jgi:molybdopterin-containing oxidoreductase family iron-sulfur binding subunit
MKTDPPNPQRESGRKYWRSLDQLAETPEFRQWAEREFPDGASEWRDPVSRRHFLRIMSASFLLAGVGGLTGCRRPEEKIFPFAKQPEHYIHGEARYYATAMPARGSAIPLLVKAYEGHPIKIEGNPAHPDSNGGTDTFAQASILNLYDPDRAQRFAQNGTDATREAALDALSAVGRQFSANGGAGLGFLLEPSSSPSRQNLQQVLGKKFPQARWFTHDPVDLEASGAAASVLAGRPVTPYYRLEKAQVILSLDGDFIGSEADTCRHCRNFAQGRKIVKPGDPMNRLYAVEGLFTLTGFGADHRLRVPAGQVLAVAAGLAAELAPGDAAIKALAQRAPLPSQVDPKWITECAADLAAHKGASLVLAGYRQPPAVQALAHLLNAALGNTGQTVVFQEREPVRDTLAELARLLQANAVNTLVILGCNPVYTAPADLDWAAAQAKAKTVIRLGMHEDETFRLCQWHLPMAHYLESWGDARTSDGTLVPVQPLIAPLFGGMTELEVLARIGGAQTTGPYDIVRENFRRLAGEGQFEERWKKFLHDGFLAGSAFQPVAVDFAPERAANLLAGAAVARAPDRDNLEVIFSRDYKLDDGRYSNNGWLQELPDPVTKVTWDGVVLVSRKTAEEFKLKTGGVVGIELGGRKINGPVWVQPGLADYTLGLTLGYGRAEKSGAGRVGGGVGLYNAYELRTVAGGCIAGSAKLRPTGQSYQVVCTQEHGSLEGRPILREANWEQFKEHPQFAKRMDLEAHSDFIPPAQETPIQKAEYPGQELPKKIYENPYRAAEKRGKQVGVPLGNMFMSELHQWGMSIDLNACVGCHACVLACQSENNVPIVGKDQVWRNREMHWLRLDRYYSGPAEQAHVELIDNPQAANLPMLCQHCEDAPCENVCPVNATVHDEEGLNLMAYNRCVGTRYCSNNCPYKVRRFNFLDYNRRPRRELVGARYPSPLVSSSRGRWNMLRWWEDPYEYHTRPEDEWELLKLAVNPDVTVRMRGVMEKCTFCVQRIEAAKIAQKNRAGQSGNVRVPDGSFTTACAQACPTEAIVFGNLLEPESRVVKRKEQARDYTVLKFLDTRPRLTYLARIRNPNPRMPDYHPVPLFMEEYIQDRGHNPFEAHGPAGPAGASPGGHVR